MAVREFDGTDDEIRFAVDALSGMTFGTTAILFKPSTDTGTKQALALHTSGGTWRALLLGHDGSNDRPNVHNGSAFSQGASSSIDDSVWHLVVYRKATGSNAGRFSVYDFNADAWSHTNGDNAIADWTSAGASGTVRMSFESSSEFFEGRLAVGAVWANEVHWTADSSGDTAIEAAGLEIDVQNWIDEAPDALWAFNQADVGTAVNDLIGNSDQTAITGTTVVTGDDPPGFAFLDLTGFVDLESTDEVLLESGDIYVLEAGAAGGGATATPAVIARSFTIPQVAVSVAAAPAVIARSFTIPQVAVSVGAAPAAIARAFSIPSPAVSVGAAPATIARAFTIPAPTISVGAAPAVVARSFTIPQVTADGGAGGDATVQPATIVLAFVIPQAAVGVGAAPALIARSFALPAVTVDAGPQSATVTPETIVLAFIVLAVTIDAEQIVDKPWKLLGGGPPIRSGHHKYSIRRPGWS
jgi:hypothetical protein